MKLLASLRSTEMRLPPEVRRRRRRVRWATLRVEWANLLARRAGVVWGVAILASVAGLVLAWRWPGLVPRSPWVGGAIAFGGLVTGVLLGAAADTTDRLVRGARHVWGVGAELVAVLPPEASSQAGAQLAASISAARPDDGVLKIALTAARTGAFGVSPWAEALGTAVAQQGASVLVVDLVTGLTDRDGAAEVAAGRRKLGDVARLAEGLRYARIGPGRDHQDAIAGLGALMDRLPRDLDVVIVAMPPMVTSSVVEATLALDAVLVVAEKDRTTRIELLSALEAVARVREPAQVVLFDGRLAEELGHGSGGLGIDVSSGPGPRPPDRFADHVGDPYDEDSSRGDEDFDGPDDDPHGDGGRGRRGRGGRGKKAGRGSRGGRSSRKGTAAPSSQGLSGAAAGGAIAGIGAAAGMTAGGPGAGAAASGAAASGTGFAGTGEAGTAAPRSTAAGEQTRTRRSASRGHADAGASDATPSTREGWVPLAETQDVWDRDATGRLTPGDSTGDSTGDHLGLDRGDRDLADQQESPVDRAGGAQSQEPVTDDHASSPATEEIERVSPAQVDESGPSDVAQGDQSGQQRHDDEPMASDGEVPDVSADDGLAAGGPTTEPFPPVEFDDDTLLARARERVAKRGQADDLDDLVAWTPGRGDDETQIVQPDADAADVGPDADAGRDADVAGAEDSSQVADATDELGVIAESGAADEAGVSDAAQPLVAEGDLDGPPVVGGRPDLAPSSIAESLRQQAIDAAAAASAVVDESIAERDAASGARQHPGPVDVNPADDTSAADLDHDLPGDSDPDGGGLGARDIDVLMGAAAAEAAMLSEVEYGDDADDNTEPSVMDTLPMRVDAPADDVADASSSPGRSEVQGSSDRSDDPSAPGYGTVAHDQADEADGADGADQVDEEDDPDEILRTTAQLSNFMDDLEDRDR